MANKIALASAFTGQQGSPFLANLSYSKGISTLLVTEANFAGLMKYLPGWVNICTGTPANVTVQYSTDGAGGAFLQSGGAGGGLYYIDGTGLNTRIVIATGTTTIVIQPMGG